MVRSGAARPAANWSVAGLSVVDVAVATVLSVGAAGLTSGLIGTSHPHGALAPSLGVLAMTGPVAGRRRFPLVAAGILAAGAIANGLAFGPMVRCGAALPAVFLVAYAVGARCDRPAAATGMVLCAANVVGQAYWDPRLGRTVLGLMIPVLTAFFATGRLVRSRDQAARTLRQRSTELRLQRERTARMAVLADRAKVAADLSETLHAALGGIAATAANGLALANHDSASTREVLATIEHRGRDALRQMREVLGHLSEDARPSPQPTFDQLSDLLAASTAATARLTVHGSPRALPASLELSGYRIVEHLLTALDDAPNAAIDVGLRFGADALELRVSGPASREADLPAVMTCARERAELHGGRVDCIASGAWYTATARLPLISGHG